MKDLKQRLEIIQENQMGYLKGGNDDAIGDGEVIVVLEDL